MEKKKIHYGWYIVIGCLLITCTMVPPITVSYTHLDVYKRQEIDTVSITINVSG